MSSTNYVDNMMVSVKLIDQKLPVGRVVVDTIETGMFDVANDPRLVREIYRQVNGHFSLIWQHPAGLCLKIKVEFVFGSECKGYVPGCILIFGVADFVQWINEEPTLVEVESVSVSVNLHEGIALLEGPSAHDFF